jgi:acetyltransferase
VPNAKKRTTSQKYGSNPLPKSAIRPYPINYVWTWTMKNGTKVTIRPIRSEDEPLMVRFHQTLSDRSVYLRYFCSLSLSRRVAPERLARICFGDYDREMVLVAQRTDPGTGDLRIIAVGRGRHGCMPSRR